MVRFIVRLDSQRPSSCVKKKVMLGKCEDENEKGEIRLERGGGESGSAVFSDGT